MDSDKGFFLNKVLMNGIKEMVFVISVDKDSNFFYKFLNQTVLERTILTKDVIGKSIQEVYPKKIADHLIEKYTEVLKTQESLTYEDIYESSYGTKHSETTLTPLYEEQDNGVYIVALVKDITKRKLTELKIQQSRDALDINKQKYRSLFDYNLDGILSIDLNGNILNGNKAVETVFGCKAEEFIDRPYSKLITSQNLEEAEQSFKDALNGKPKSRQLTILHSSGETIEVIMKFTPIIVNEEIVGIYGIFKDINEQIKLGRKYKESEDLSRIITENSNDLITIINSDYEIVYVSPSYKKVLAFDDTEYIRNSFLHNVHQEDANAIQESFVTSIKNHQPWKEQFRQMHGNGDWIWSELHGSPVYDEKDRFVHMVVVSRNITLRKDYELKLQYMAYHDPLTELPNRRLFMDQLTLQLQKVMETDDRLALIMMDLDEFKKINDKFGHDMGDKVIQEFGKRINEIIRDEDMLARLGGDEFIVLLPDISSSEDVEELAKRIIDNMNEPWCVDGQVVVTTTSMGIVISPPQKSITPNDICKYADKALYNAKEDGKNNYKVYDFQEVEA
ncbi:diguanylate cyclase domain-containing protein [Virgibacillus byunsanensis]|uniref:Diguanylate cyclase domain-containing protein n=1 Tax=Virgibacillus byunsanensis TaxID=570945 RepID=A0ABW3LT94_9BACI